MDDQELRNLLEQLHMEIERTPAMDEKGQQLLSDLGTDILSLLDRSKNQNLQQPHPSTVQRMEEAIDYLEVTHPNLTTMLSELLATLSNSGI
jgi:hypothetical protein